VSDRRSADRDCVPLVLLDQSNWLAALEVRVTDEQLPMVAHHQPVALEILAKAYLQPGGRRWEPLGYVDADGSMVAVLALSHADEVAQVRNLAVDMRHQRRGVGSQVMRSVVDWCRHAGAARVELTFNPSNEAAARLYQRAGLRPTGEVREGEPVWSIDVQTT
jgi:diamine N-acetyltransferase